MLRSTNGTARVAGLALLVIAVGSASVATAAPERTDTPITLSGAVSSTAPMAEAPPPTAELLDQYADWLLERADGERRNGLVRKLPYLYGPTLFDEGDCTAAAPCLEPDVEQSTAACVSLEFLSTFYPARAENEGGAVSPQELAVIHEFAGAVLDYRIDPDPGSEDLFDGAVASSLDGNLHYYTTFGNATCGQALLRAHEVTGEDSYLDAAVGIGDFLLRMQDPRDYYAEHDALPFVDSDGEAMEPPGGFFDQVSSWNNLFSTMSLWNMTAVAYLEELQDAADEASGRYSAAAAQARVFLEEGLDHDSDWYTVAFHSPQPSRNRIVAQAAYAANCQDNRWHRKGSCEYEDGRPAGGTYGTDMVEYALAAMFRYDEAVGGTGAGLAAVAGHYERFTSLPALHTATSVNPLACVDDSRAGQVDPYYPPDNQGDVPSGDPWDFDPHLSFGGYFRSAGTELVSHEAKYYDIVGFGILAEIRAALVPDKFRHGYERLSAADEGGLVAILDRTLTPMALPGRDTGDLDGDGDTTEAVCILTVGTLPIAHNGLGLLHTYGYVTDAVAEEPTGEPTTPEPTGEPTTGEPPTEEPITPEPTEEPTTEGPSAEQPTTEEPTTLEPTGEPTTGGPSTEEPTTTVPTGAPTSDEPAGKPTAVETTTGPTTIEPTEQAAGPGRAPTAGPAPTATVAGGPLSGGGGEASGAQHAMPATGTSLGIVALAALALCGAGGMLISRRLAVSVS